MSQVQQFKDTRRERVFELIRQKSQAENTADRLRRLSRRSISDDDLERFRDTAALSLRAGAFYPPEGLDVQ